MLIVVNKIHVNAAQVLHQSALSTFKPNSTNVYPLLGEKVGRNLVLHVLGIRPSSARNPICPTSVMGYHKLSYELPIAAGINVLIRTYDELASLYLTGNTAFPTASCKQLGPEWARKYHIFNKKLRIGGGDCSARESPVGGHSRARYD